MTVKRHGPEEDISLLSPEGHLPGVASSASRGRWRPPWTV